MRPLTIAFLGCGDVTRMHSRTLSRVEPRIRRAYASRDAGRAEAYAREFEGLAYSSYESALVSRDVDAVFIATPPATHLELAISALETGKDVIVEKPAFPSTRDFDLVASVARRTRRTVFVAENYFYKPLARVLREILAGGEIGDVRFINVNALKHQQRGGWRDDPALASGGALFEGGVHWINLIANLGLTIVRAHGFRAGCTTELERSSLVVAEYQGGAVATLAHSWEIRSWFHGARLSKIFGTAGSITFESNGAFVFVRSRRPRLMFPGMRDLTGYGAMWDDFVYALAHRQEPRMTLAIARRDVEFLEMIEGGTPGESTQPMLPMSLVGA